MKTPFDVEVIEKDFQKVKSAIKGAFSAPDKAFYARVGNRLKNQFVMGFRQSRGPDGKPWAPITHRKGKPLIDTGRLRRSINSRAGDDFVEVGTNVVYGRAMQEGIGKINVPAHTKLINHVFGKPIEPKTVSVKAHSKNANVKGRPFLGIEAPQKQMIIKLYDEYLTKKTGQSPT